MLRRIPLGRILATLAAYAIGAVHFVAFINLSIDVIHVYGGLVAFSGLAAIVVLGLVMLCFVLGVPAYYAAGERRGTFLGRLLLLSGIQALLFFLLHVLRYVVNYFLRPSPLDYVVGGAGLLVGVACIVLAARQIRAARQARRTTLGL